MLHGGRRDSPRTRGVIEDARSGSSGEHSPQTHSPRAPVVQRKEKDRVAVLRRLRAKLRDAGDPIRSRSRSPPGPERRERPRKESYESFDEFISEEVPALAAPFVPARAIKGALMQTTSAAVLHQLQADNLPNLPSISFVSSGQFCPPAPVIERRERAGEIRFDRQTIRTASSGAVAIDWFDTGDGYAGDGPVVLAWPGAGGCQPDGGFQSILLEAITSSFGSDPSFFGKPFRQK